MADEAPWWPWALGAAVGGVVVGTVATLLWRASQAPAASSTTSTTTPTTTTSTSSSSTTTAPTSTTTTTTAPSTPTPVSVTLADATAIPLSLRPGTALTVKLPAGAQWMGTLEISTRPTTNFSLTSAPLTSTVATPQTGTYNGGGVTLRGFWQDASGAGWSTDLVITDA
jgi:cytoskeletal protein RodZ